MEIELKGNGNNNGFSEVNKLSAYDVFFLNIKKRFKKDRNWRIGIMNKYDDIDWSVSAYMIRSFNFRDFFYYIREDLDM